VSEQPQVTRSAAAVSGPAAGRVDARRRALPNGVWGMALFLCSEITVFGTMLGSYFYLNFEAKRWPPDGIKAPSVVLPLVATGLLLFTTVPMWLAVRAGRRGERGRVLGLISAATVLQCIYLAGQILLFRHDLRDFSPQGSAYGSIYFTVLATHHAHVAFGILLNLTVLLFITVRGLNNYWFIGVRGLALYWYVVSGVGILVTLTQLSPTL
jgi:cytochrome c oxidase subunit 3